jgi:hypothetical protein
MDSTQRRCENRAAKSIQEYATLYHIRYDAGEQCFVPANPEAESALSKHGLLSEPQPLV